MDILPSQPDNDLSAADDGAVFDGLPDDLSYQILARIPFASQSSAKAVCKAWLNALSSGTTYEIRKSEGRLEKLLCVAVNSRYLPEGITVLPVKVYQPDTRQWHCLPPLLLWGGPGHLMEFKCVAIGPELFVIGGQRAVQSGAKARAAVWYYKGREGYWEAIASMHFQTKPCAVAGAVEGKLFVVGMEILQSAIHTMGLDVTWSTVTEVMDTSDKTRQWMRLTAPAPPMSLQYWMAGAVVHNRLFHVVSRKAEGGYLASTLDTRAGNWRVEFDFVPEIMYVAGIAPFGTVNGLLYCVFWRGGAGSSTGAMLCTRTETGPWVEVGEVDVMTHGKRKCFELSRTEGFKVEVMDNRLYIMEFGYTDDDSSRERGQCAGRKFNVLHILRIEGGAKVGEKREYIWEAQDIEMENGMRPQERILGLCSIEV